MGTAATDVIRITAASNPRGNGLGHRMATTGVAHAAGHEVHGGLLTDRALMAGTLEVEEVVVVTVIMVVAAEVVSAAS